MNPLIQFKKKLVLPLFITGVFACFGLSPQARAVCQEGCLANSNTVLGDDALISFTTGSFNTAIGLQALGLNTTGGNNTASGVFALLNNTTGGNNTASGAQALLSNTTGFANMASGTGALSQNTTGSNNTASGTGALGSNTTGNFNTASGNAALGSNTTGSVNTASGYQALRNNTTGDNNIALGQSAGVNLTTGDSNIDIGNRGVAAEANTIRIGTAGTQTRTFIAGIAEAAIMGAPLKVNAAGQLGTAPSSRRFKTEIRPMDKTSEAIHALKPVTFRYKHEVDPDGTPQFGLIAEEVEKVNADLVARGANGKPYTVRYDAVNAMLLNEFLKEHRKVEQQGAIIAKQQKQIEALSAGLQKVSDQLELRKPAARIVDSNH